MICLSTLSANSQSLIKVNEDLQNGDVVELYSQARAHWEPYSILDSFTIKGIAGVLIDIEECFEVRDSLDVRAELLEMRLAAKDEKIENLVIESSIKDGMLNTKDTYIEQLDLGIKELKDERKKKAKSTTAKDIAFSLVIIGLSVSTIVLGAK